MANKPAILTTTVGSYPIPDWLSAVPSDQARTDATRVIFHTAVLTYVGPTERAEFARSVTSFCDVWIANEAPQVFPDIAARAGTPGPRGQFLLAANGQPLAWADPHGASLDWIA